MPVLDNRKNHPNHQSHPNDALNFMDYALENLENLTLDDVQLKQRQTKPHFINGDSNHQNQLIYEEYIQELEQNLSQTRNTRVKATLFPELFQDDDETNYAQLTNCEPNAVARLAECAQMLKHAVVNLVHYQDDADLAQKAIPELISLLNDDCDQLVLQNAMLMVYQLSKKDASRHAISNNPNIIASVIRVVMEHENNHELLKVAAHTLYNLSQHRQGLLAIFKSGAINCLVKLLGSPVEKVVFFAISSLHNLLLHQEGSKMVVRLSGGLQKMVSLLSRNSYKLLTYVTDCLHLMIYGNQEGKLILLASGAPQELVRIMKTYTYEKLLWTTSRVLMVLSVCSSNKPAIIQSGGLQALSVHLKNASERLVQACLYALRNLSDDQSIMNENLEQLITSLVDLINSERPSIVLCVTGILSNITCNNQHAKQLVCQVNSIPYLINVLIKFPDRDDILEPTICILRHITNRQTEAEFASNAIRINNGIPILVKLLNSSARWFLLKVIVGVLRNLAFNVQNHQQFREQQAINKLIGLLLKAHNEVKRHKTNESNGALLGASLSSGPVYVDGVSMNEVIEATVGALQLLAKQPVNRDLMRPNSELIQMLVELLYNEQEAVQRVAVATLCELAAEKEGADKIEQEGATIPLTNLLNSRNEAISTYSAAILYQFSDGKSLDYKKQLTSELSSTLYRDDLNLNATNNWQMLSSMNSATANDLDNINLLYPQFATLNNSLTNQIGSTLYQDVYTQASFGALPSTFPLDASLNANDYGTYGQIAGTLTQPAPANTAGWYDTDL